MYVVLNFPTLDFLVHKIKQWEFHKKYSVILYHIYTYPDWDGGHEALQGFGRSISVLKTFIWNQRYILEMSFFTYTYIRAYVHTGAGGRDRGDTYYSPPPPSTPMSPNAKIRPLIFNPYARMIRWLHKSVV